MITQTHVLNEIISVTEPPETARFWQLNSIDALRFMPRVETNLERFASDPEHLEQMQKNSTELKALLARENAVRRRYNAIFKANIAEVKRERPAPK